ncbi:MAG: enoyl-CoA hydratase-related protein [Pseudomonadota bacterium]
MNERLSSTVSVSLSADQGGGMIGHLRLARPERHNALSLADWQAIPKAIARLNDDGARVIIVSGDGASFCAGADISEFDVVRKDPASARHYEAANSDAFAAIRMAAVPTVAAINGFCLGGGFGLAAACDLRIATPKATFGVPAARLGLAYPVDAMEDIVNGVGLQAAKRLLFTAERIDAEHALRLGFLSEIVEVDRLEDKALTVAGTIASLAPLTHRATKATLAALTKSAAGDALERAKDVGDVTFDSQDYAEGRRAFREKRPANFKGI